MQRTPASSLFPYTTLFRSGRPAADLVRFTESISFDWRLWRHDILGSIARSEEHTSELQSHVNLVCRLLPEKKTRRLHRNWSLAEPIVISDQNSYSTLAEVR